MAQDARLRRRMLGLIKARLPDLQLDSVDDPRSARGRRWQLAALLAMVLVGMLTGCQSLLDVEQLSVLMTSAARRLLGISRRVPDTTMRTVLCGLLPEAIRSLLHRPLIKSTEFYIPIAHNIGIRSLPFFVLCNHIIHHFFFIFLT